MFLGASLVSLGTLVPSFMVSCAEQGSVFLTVFVMMIIMYSCMCCLRVSDIDHGRFPLFYWLQESVILIMGGFCCFAGYKCAQS